MANIIERTCTITSGTDTSDAVKVYDGELVGVVTDSQWTEQSITFKDASSQSGTFITAKDSAGSAITVPTVSASDSRFLASYGTQGFMWVKVVSAAAQTNTTTVCLRILQR